LGAVATWKQGALGILSVAPYLDKSSLRHPWSQKVIRIQIWPALVGNEDPVWNGGEIQKIWRIPVPEARNGVCCACGRG